MHRHSAFEVIQIINGHEEVIINDETFTMHAGDILLLQPNVRHSMTTLDTTAYFNFHFSIDDARFIQQMARHNTLHFKNGTKINYALQQNLGAMRTLLDENMNYSFRTEFDMLFYFGAFLHDLTERVELTGDVSNNQASLAIKIMTTIQETLQQQVQNYLEHGLTNNQPNGLSIENICHELQISPSYAFEVFKKVYNQSPRQFLSKIMIQQAQLLLLTPELRISDVSNALGYQEPSHFTRQFKKWTGETLREFQRNTHVVEG